MISYVDAANVLLAHSCCVLFFHFTSCLEGQSNWDFGVKMESG